MLPGALPSGELSGETCPKIFPSVGFVCFIGLCAGVFALPLNFPMRLDVNSCLGGEGGSGGAGDLIEMPESGLLSEGSALDKIESKASRESSSWVGEVCGGDLGAGFGGINLSAKDSSEDVRSIGPL